MTSTTEDYSRRYQIFGGSSKEITRKTRIWRYMTFEKFCWMVEKSVLYHSRLDMFEDPFEGSVTQEYARRRDNGEFLTPEMSPADVEAQRRHDKREPTNWRRLRLSSYATCWHASDCESHALWKLYASEERGLAVVSTMERLQRAVTFDEADGGLLSQVEYVDFKTHDMRHRPFFTRMRPGFVKRKSFQHEREVRGLIYGRSLRWDDEFLDEMAREMPHGKEANVDLSELVESIVVSPTAAPYFEELVRIITKRHKLDHVVRTSELIGEPVY